MTSRHHNYVVLDLETFGPDGAVLTLLEEPTAARNLKDPEKIAADIADKRQARDKACSLDPYGGRIVCVGWQTESERLVSCCPTEDEERDAICAVAIAIRAASRHVIGFVCLRFDIPWLITRARLLDVDFPDLDLRKYGNRDITDLQALLTFDGTAPDGAFKRSLANFARRFGIPVHDTTTGAEVAAMVREGRWDDIEAHCASDLDLTVALAERLRLIPKFGINVKSIGVSYVPNTREVF